MSRYIKAITAQLVIPNTVGSTKARAVHLRLPVSFFIVIRVVEQGQWKSIKITVQIAVKGVQPFVINTSLAADKEVISAKCSAPE